MLKRCSFLILSWKTADKHSQPLPGFVKMPSLLDGA